MSFNRLIAAVIVIFSFAIADRATAQGVVQETFYYNPGGFTYIPALRKPSVIYQGRLFVGRRQLQALFDHVNNQELHHYFRRYKANKTAAAITSVAGAGLAVFSFVHWRSDDQQKFNWYIFGGSLLMSGFSGYLDGRANENLRQAALRFNEATRKSTMVPPQQKISITIPLAR